MNKHLSLLLLTFSLVLVLTACGGDKTVTSSASPGNVSASASPAAATASPEPATTSTPIVDNEPTPSPTAAPEKTTSPTPKASPAATAKATVKPTATPIATPKATPVSTPVVTPKAEFDEAAIAAIVKQSCIACHGVELAGDFGPSLQKVGARLTKEQIMKQINDGSDDMPAFGKKLKATEIQSLAAWLAAKK